jgi:acetyl/propionyl-CoA carboxylase alpha subunit
VTPFYDPMIAKVIATAPTGTGRSTCWAGARRRGRRGPATNLAFLRRVVRAEPFRRLAIDTGWLDREGGFLTVPDEPGPEDLALAGTALLLRDDGAAPPSPPPRPTPARPGTGRTAGG